MVGVDERAKGGEGLAPDTNARENTASKTFGAQNCTSKSIRDNPRYEFSNTSLEMIHMTARVQFNLLNNTSPL